MCKYLGTYVMLLSLNQLITNNSDGSGWLPHQLIPTLLMYLGIGKPSL